MKAIQITMDEDLLSALDRDEEVKRQGRSAVLRRITRDYLERRVNDAVTKRYRKAYGGKKDLGSEFAGWEDEGAWPPE